IICKKTKKHMRHHRKQLNKLFRDCEHKHKHQLTSKKWTAIGIGCAYKQNYVSKRVNNVLVINFEAIATKDESTQDHKSKPETRSDLGPGTQSASNQIQDNTKPNLIRRILLKLLHLLRKIRKTVFRTIFGIVNRVHNRVKKVIDFLNPFERHAKIVHSKTTDKNIVKNTHNHMEQILFRVIEDLTGMVPLFNILPFDIRRHSAHKRIANQLW